MAGFDINRIVDRDSRFAETIQCSICLLILNNPLMTKCGHNYCNQCLKEIVESGIKSCPDCRKGFTKKRPKESSNESNVVFRRNSNVFVFSKNFTLKEMIGKLKISCDYESNGCKESVELESLSQHMTRCEYRFCKTCEFRPIGESDEHNCIEVLKNMNNELKEKYEKSLNTIKESEDKLELTKTSANEHKDELDRTKAMVDNLEVSLKAANDTIKRLQGKSSGDENFIETLQLQLNKAKEREERLLNDQSNQLQLQTIRETEHNSNQIEDEMDLQCHEELTSEFHSTGSSPTSSRSTKRPGTPMPGSAGNLTELLLSNQELVRKNQELLQSCIRKSARLEKAAQREQQYLKLAQELERSNYEFANIMTETIKRSETRARLAELQLITEKTSILDAYKTVATKQAFLKPFDTNCNSGYRMIANHTNRIYPTAGKTQIKADPNRNMKVVLYGDFHYNNRGEQTNQPYHYDQSDFQSNSWTYRVYHRASHLTGQSVQDPELMLLDFKTLEYQLKTPSKDKPLSFSGQTLNALCSNLERVYIGVFPKKAMQRITYSNPNNKVFDSNKHIFKPDKDLFLTMIGQFPNETNGNTPPLHQAEVTNLIDHQEELYTNEKAEAEIRAEIAKLKEDLNGCDRRFTPEISQLQKTHDGRVADIRHLMRTLTGNDSLLKRE